MHSLLQNITIDDISAFVFDFDGVMTNNLVYIDQTGSECVSCSRGDGLAFDVLRKLEKPAYILSTEKNPVVKARAEKLQVPVLHGISNKVSAINELVRAKKYDLRKIFYVGNDLNDYRIMQKSGYTACPSDSHPIIKQIASITLQAKGGDGVIRELLEEVLKLDFIEILYPE
jgi:YrbI family 3-deoxy-D-manno-octulosonate 8-phosphate phosphatase